MIVVHELIKRYGDKVAVDGLSFSAQPGRITALLGPNGAGKTTTLRILLGLARPNAGRALINGYEYADLRDPIATVGAVFEESTYHPARSARSHLQILAAAAGLPSLRVAEALALVELLEDADRRVGAYSLGMRQRLGLAAALLGDPQTLVLDEPQNGLDPHGTAWLRHLLRRLADEGRTVLISSHLLAEVTEIADDVVVVRSGKLVRRARLQDLLGEEAVVRVAAAELDRLAHLLRGAGLAVEGDTDNRLLIRGCSAPDVGAVAATNGITLHELTTLDRRLEDVFLELTRNEALDLR